MGENKCVKVAATHDEKPQVGLRFIYVEGWDKQNTLIPNSVEICSSDNFGETFKLVSTQ